MRGVTGATDTTLGKPPRAPRARRADRGAGRRAQTLVQFGVSGATEAIRRYRVRLSGRRPVALAPGQVDPDAPPPRPPRAARDGAGARHPCEAARDRARTGAAGASGQARRGQRQRGRGRDPMRRVLLRPAPRAHCSRRRARAGGDDPRERLVHDVAAGRRPRMVLPARGPPPAAFTLVGGGTEAGIADAARGIVDVGLASRARLPTDPGGLVFTPFAASGVCLVTHASNPLPELTRAGLQELVSGARASWAQVAGVRGRTRSVPVALDLGTGARSVFLSTFVDAATGSRTSRARSPRPSRCATSCARRRPRGDTSTSRSRGLCTSSRTRASPARARPSPAARTRPAGARVRHARPAARGRRALHPLGADSRTARRVIATRYVPIGEPGPMR